MKTETTVAACKTRIHTLISAYRSFKDECAKTGNATPKNKAAFFHEVDEILSDKPCTKSKIIIKSATSATITLVVRCERDDQLTMFNGFIKLCSIRHVLLV